MTPRNYAKPLGSCVFCRFPRTPFDAIILGARASFGRGQGLRRYDAEKMSVVGFVVGFMQAITKACAPSTTLRRKTPLPPYTCTRRRAHPRCIVSWRRSVVSSFYLIVIKEKKNTTSLRRFVWQGLKLSWNSSKYLKTNKKGGF